MAQAITPVSIIAPGTWGLNTQDSPVDMNANFALDLRNVVIDRSGRISSRKGWVTGHTVNAATGAGTFDAIGELVRNDGTTTIIGAANNKIFKMVGTTLTELTYGGGGVAPVITANNWQMVVLNDLICLFQRGYDPLIYDPTVSTTTYRRLSEKSGSTGVVPKAHSAVSAYGRIWCVDTDTTTQVVYWCDTSAPHIWTAGTSGTLNLFAVWPSGGDKGVALAAHNGNLIIFGSSQTLIYTGATNPATMALGDSILEIGCVSRDTVQNTGTDILFLSNAGLRGIARTIQEKSAPIGSISKNVENDIQAYIGDAVTDSFRSVYSPTDGFYLLTFLTNGVTYCFDTRMKLQDGSARVTMWIGITAKSWLFTQDRTLYIGQTSYIGKYQGYDDNGASYRMVYYSPWIDFGNPMKLSILKKLRMYLTSGTGQSFVFKYGIDYVSGKGSFTVTENKSPAAQYGISEYGVDEYNTGATDPISVNIGGAGRVIQVALETLITNRQTSLQRVDIYTKEGRL